jgi:hypothetical protein
MYLKLGFGMNIVGAAIGGSNNEERGSERRDAA